MLTTVYYSPEFRLQPHVSHYIATSYNAAATPAFQLSCSHIGCALLCFSLDDGFTGRMEGGSENFEMPKFSFIPILEKSRFFYPILWPKISVSVVFKPYGAYQLLAIPQNDVYDEPGTGLINILGNKIAPLLIKIEDAGSNIDLIINLINGWLSEQLVKNQVVTVDRILYACKLIEANAGNFRIEQLAQEVCLSKRLLEYQFQEQVGVSPKLYSRIVRFNALQRDIVNEKIHDWQQLAYKYNFFDQAHLIKEYKYFSGATPTQLAEHYAYVR